MTAQDADQLVVDGWAVDVAGHRLVRDGAERHLEPRALDVLLRLARHPGVVVTRRELMSDVWGGTYVTEDAVSAAVIRLRRALDDSARDARVVVTVARSGYRLTADLVRRGEVVGEGRSPGTPEPAVRVGSVVHVRPVVESTTLDPDDWHRIRMAIAADVEAAAADRDGSVVTESSSLVAAFGVPRSRGDHAARAVQFALDVVALLDGTERLGSRVRVSCGIDSGEVLHADGTVYGAPVQHAARLAAHAGAGAVMVSDDVAEALGSTSTERVAEGHLVVAAPGDVTTWDFRRRRGLTPLAGRVPDIAALEARADDVEEGLGRVVVLLGDAGVGKSRLVHELRGRLEARGWRSAVGPTSSLDPRSPYVALRRLLASSVTETPTDAAAWAAVMSPEHLDPQWQAIDPAVRQQRVTEMSLDVLLVDDRPVLLVVEDAHWADEATRAWLTALTDRIGRRRVLLLITTRPTLAERWSDRSHGSRVRVGPLFPDDAAALLGSLVGDDDEGRGWREELLERAAGNPLFLEECVRVSRAGDADGGRTVPTSLRGVLSERVDALSADARAVASRASVVGRSTPESLLTLLVDQDAGALASAFDELARSEVLRPVRSRHGVEWEFSHALLQEAVYADIAGDARRDIHRRVAALTADGSLATAGRVAWHLAEAGEVEPAIEARLRAARSAAEAVAFDDARAHLDEAERLMHQMSASDARDGVALRIELARGTAAVQVDGPTAMTTKGAFDRAAALAERVGSARETFEALWGVWFVMLHSGDLVEAAALADRISQLAGEQDDPALVLEAHHVQWSGLLLLGRTSEGLAHARAGIAIYRPDEHHRLTYSYGGHDPGVCALNLAALSTWLLGDPVESRRLSEDAVALAASLGHAYSQIEGCHAALTIAAVEGRADDLARHVATLDRLIADGSVPDTARGFADGFRGAWHHGNADDAEAVRLLERAAPVWREFWGAWCLPLDSLLAEALVAEGRADDAVEVLLAARTIASTSHAPWWDAELLRVDAVVTRANDPLADVTALLDAACSAADVSGSTRLRARVLETASALTPSPTVRRRASVRDHGNVS